MHCCVSTATVVMRRLHTVTLNVRCVSCIDFMYVTRTILFRVFMGCVQRFPHGLLLRVLVICNNFIFK